jgi:type IX secretion system PorP/SprF family membrane protein
MKLKKILYILFFIYSGIYAQHNIVYSQYYFSGILINPAYAGSQGALNFTSIYRTQWTGINGAPENISVGLHSPFKNDKMNGGLIFLNNKFGITSESKIMAVYAYKVRFAKGSLSFGLQGGAEYVKNDWSEIQTTDNNDLVFENNSSTAVNAIFGCGLFYKTEKMFLGISSPIIYNTKNNYQLSYSPYILSSGFLIRVNDNIVVKPAGLVRYVKASPIEGDISTAVYLKEIIGIGAGFRSSAAVYGYIDIRLNEQFSAGYAYDYTLSRLNNYSNGSHEFMLRYLFSYKVNVKSPRYF